MTKKDLPSKYEAREHEARIYELWEKSGAFKPKSREAGPSAGEAGEKTFSILMPPPNANGSLHVGHGVFVTLEDLMIRYHRMKGEATVWFPGLDHAGFETQIVFEKHLEKQGKSRFDYDRDELFAATLKFTEEQSENIRHGLKRLGASADWSREFFTLDSEIVNKVYETFVTLYEDGLAYRDSRPVHWCPKHQTTLSDLELKDKTQVDPLYFIKYGPLVVATARPETIFADVAVAVHPDDERYRQYVGTEIEVDFGIETRKIPVVADEMVDPEFGTGAVKITPAHDANDFEVAKRHDLPLDKFVIDERAKLTELAGPFAGQKVEEARVSVAKLLKEKGLVDHVDEKYSHSIKTCYKCGRTIEPRILPQWFINVNDKGKSGKALAPDAARAITEGETTFVTDRFRKIFDHWMEIIRDWPISRQIVWGIRLPVWYCQCGGTTVKVPSQTEIIFMRHGEAEHNVQEIGNGDPAKPYMLTAKGISQTEETANKLAEETPKFDAIIASEMQRVQQTAEIMTKQFDGEVITDARLNDIGLGRLEGEPIKKLHELTNYHERSVEGSETYAEVHARVEEFVKDLAEKYSDNRKILVVTSEIIFWALRKVLNPELEPHEMRHHVKNGETYTFSLGDLTPCAKCGALVTERDTDVFDTWFSSGQLPVIVPQTRKDSADFDRFYPTSVMETGWDILFFWVARMMMFGQYLTGEVPFKDIYLHGMIRDKDRQKMSKSKGNVLDPLAIIDEYGSDALRLSLVFGTSAGNDMPISEDKVRGMRNFANKLWNISRFILMNLSEQETGNRKQTQKAVHTRLPARQGSQFTVPQANTAADKTILAELNKTIESTTKHFDEYRFHEAAQELYQFVWSDLADTYLEVSKEQLASNDSELVANTQKLLLYTLSQSLKLLHPIMPFVTEVIWQQLPAEAKDSELLISSSWPGSRS